MIGLQHQRLATAVRRSSPGAPATASAPRAALARAGPEPIAASSGRRALVLSSAAAAALLLLPPPLPAAAISTNPFEYKKEIKRRRRKVDPSEYTQGPKGLLFYDLVEGDGETATVGDRVATHYELKLRGVTIYTTRVGLGVTGGNPQGFSLGEPAGGPGAAGIEGLDLGVQGMRVGGVRLLIVPPGLAYGRQSLGEIPPNSTLNLAVELLSIKTNPLGYRVKLVEG